MTRMAASKARQEFSDTLNRVAFGRERIVLHRRGKNLAAIVPVEDLAFLDELENRLDLEAAHKALKERGNISWKKVKKQLGL